MATKAVEIIEMGKLYIIIASSLDHLFAPYFMVQTSDKFNDTHV